MEVYERTSDMITEGSLERKHNNENHPIPGGYRSMGHAEIIDPKAFYEAGSFRIALKYAE